MNKGIGSEEHFSEENSTAGEILGRIVHGILAIDVDGHCVYMNKKAGEMLALEPDQVMNQSIWNHFPDTPEHLVRKACEKAVTSQQYHCLETSNPADGRWVEYDIHPSATGVSIFFKDVTARKKAEEEWQRAENQYRALIEQASDAIMITDLQGNFLEVNSSLCKLFGYSREELMNVSVTVLIDPEQLKTDPFTTEYLETGQPMLRERRMIRKDGTIVEVEANVKFIPGGRLLAIARDITERKKAAEQILREKEMSESIINSLPGVFLIREVGGKNLRWNKRFEEVSGYTAAEIPDLGPFHFFEDGDKEYMRQRVQNLLVVGRSSSEVIIVTKAGKRVPIYLTGIVMQLEGKTCVITIGMDISERKKAEEELRLANEQLRDLSAHLQNVREEERKRIALEIHDELGQQLTALKMDLS